MQLAPDLFPSFVSFVSLAPGAQPDPLFPEEAAAIERAVEKRKLEFALGRTCARRALAALGVSPTPLRMNEDRSVAWPDQAWGSITHAEGFYAAAAAPRTQVRGLGIDAEVRARVEPRLWDHIASEREIAWFRSAPSAHEANERATLLFSAKEAFYKAQFCVSEAWVGFHDAELTIDEAARAFEVELLIDAGDAFARGTRFSGRYQLLANHVLTRVIIPSD